MSRTRCPVNKTNIRRAVEIAEDMGKSVAGVEVKPDGTFFVRFGEPLAPTEGRPSDDLADLVDRIKADGKTRRAS